MNQVFYKYASSDEKKRVIDNHVVEIALDQWSWYWILCEINLILLISCLISLFYSKLIISFIIVLIITAILLIMKFINNKCIEYAIQEIELILEDSKRKKEIKKVFDAL